MHQILLNWSHLGSSIAERWQFECWNCNLEALSSIPRQPLARFVLGSPKFYSLVMPVNSQLVFLWPVGSLNHDSFVYFSYLFLPSVFCGPQCTMQTAGLPVIVLCLQSHLFSFCANLFQVLTFLDKGGSKLNYRLYGECLFDILFAGGVLGMMFL